MSDFQQDLNDFFEVQTPAAANEPPASTGTVSADIAALLQQQQTLAQQQNQMLQHLAYNSYQPPTPTPQPAEETKLSEIPISFTAEGKPYVAGDVIEDLVERRASNQVNETLRNFAPALESVQQQQAISIALEQLKQTAPDLLKDRDPNQVAALAIDLYNSPLIRTANPAQRTDEAIQRLRQIYNPNTLPTSTGDGQVFSQDLPAYNQIGRTPANNPASSPYPYEKGATIKIKQKSINDLGGINPYMDYVEQVNNMEMYNRQHNMGWKFVHE